MIMMVTMMAMTAHGRYYVGATHRAALRARFNRWTCATRVSTRTRSHAVVSGASQPRWLWKRRDVDGPIGRPACPVVVPSSSFPTKDDDGSDVCSSSSLGALVYIFMSWPVDCCVGIIPTTEWLASWIFNIYVSIRANIEATHPFTHNIITCLLMFFFFVLIYF